MTAGGFDRVRPRSPKPTRRIPAQHDSEGKRALFSSNELTIPAPGSVVVDCSRCGVETVLSPFAAARAVLPSLVLSFALGHGERETTLGLLRRRRHGALLRCPACGRPAWVRFTVRV
jgi:predicted RNA-binding Zn-ribbon protein involved in translation (DUF1610 family)